MYLKFLLWLFCVALFVIVQEIVFVQVLRIMLQSQNFT
jgi:hypothetical protein